MKHNIRDRQDSTQRTDSTPSTRRAIEELLRVVRGPPRRNCVFGAREGGRKGNSAGKFWGEGGMLIGQQSISTVENMVGRGRSEVIG